MQPDKAGGIGAKIGENADRQGRGIGGKDALLCKAVKTLCDDGLFEVYVLRHRFNDQIRSTDRLIAVRRNDPIQH